MREERGLQKWPLPREQEVRSRDRSALHGRQLRDLPHARLLVVLQLCPLVWHLRFGRHIRMHQRFGSGERGANRCMQAVLRLHGGTWRNHVPRDVRAGRGRLEAPVLLPLRRMRDRALAGGMRVSTPRSVGRAFHGLRGAVLGTCLAAMVAACSGDDGPAPLNQPLGTGCFDDSYCASGHCPGGKLEPATYGICTHSCRVDADCADGPKTDDPEHAIDNLSVCGIAGDGHRWCVPRCPHKTSAQYVCENAVSTECRFAHEPDCNLCGCPSETYCSSSKCVAQVDVGESCTANQDCKNLHCLASTKKCGVETGSPCTADNCEICLTHESWSFCNYSDSCGACDNLGSAVCISDQSDARIGACKPLCDTEPGKGIKCPGTCVGIGINSEHKLYCRCEECEIARSGGTCMYPNDRWLITCAGFDIAHFARQRMNQRCDLAVTSHPSVCDPCDIAIRWPNVAIAVRIGLCAWFAALQEYSTHDSASIVVPSCGAVYARLRGRAGVALYTCTGQRLTAGAGRDHRKRTGLGDRHRRRPEVSRHSVRSASGRELALETAGRAGELEQHARRDALRQQLPASADAVRARQRERRLSVPQRVHAARGSARRRAAQRSGDGLDPRRRVPVRREQRLRSARARRQERRRRQHQLSPRRARLPRAPRAHHGRRRHLGQLRLPRSASGVALGEAQHRALRR